MKDEIDEILELLIRATVSCERLWITGADHELSVYEAKQAILALKKKWEQEAKTEERYKTKYEILSKISSMHLTVDRQAFGENYTCDIMPYISKKLSDQLNGDK